MDAAVKDRPTLNTAWSMLIGGERVQAASGETFDVTNPSTGQVFAQAPRGTAVDVDRAVASARQAFEDRRWLKIAPRQREKIFWKLAELIEANAERLGEVEATNNGMPLRFSRFMPLRVAEMVRYLAGWIERMDGRANELHRNGEMVQAFTRREPVGVAGLIVPWNGPLSLAAEKVCAALTAGCTAVLKPAEETPLTALMFGELCLEAGIPPGVLNVVTGFGHEAGAAISAHMDVDKISFTGSTEVGRLLIQAAGATNLKRLTLELGGKSPMVVFDDANLEAAIAGAAAGIFTNAGQVCSAASRLFIHEKVFEPVAQGVAEIARGMKLGGYLDDQAQMGPLISAKQRGRVEGYVKSGIADGAEPLAGGAVGSGDGFFFQPTVMVKCHQRMSMVREEIFGPVVSVMPFSSEEEVIAAANDTTYGLSGSVWTGDMSRGHRVANRLRAGRVGINNHPARELSMPAGGVKQSGWGREGGPEGVGQFLEYKSVYL